MTEIVPPAVRRSRHLVVHWGRTGLHAVNFATREDGPVSESDLAILCACDGWTERRALARRCDDGDSASLDERVERLVRATFLESADEERRPSESRMERWAGWNPAAGFFHAASRDVPFVPPALDRPQPILTLRERPPAVKDYPDAPGVTLEPPDETGELARVLLSRRTWRRFGDGSVRLEELATLLGLTFGVQGWIDDGGPVPLKTAPSGGAKHSIEAYVVSRNVDGLAPGVYHYDPDAHALSRLPSAGGDTSLVDLVAGQTWFGDAPVVAFMTSVFARVRHKYEFPLAYRVVLLEAGHLAQTFLLLATHLGLAPFCTAALADSEVERQLGIDGIEEAVMYAVGAGRRPEGVDWAPWSDPNVVPTVHPPAHSRHRTRSAGP